MGLVRCEREHDEVGVEAVQRVPGVWVVAGLRGGGGVQNNGDGVGTGVGACGHGDTSGERLSSAIASTPRGKSLHLQPLLPDVLHDLVLAFSGDGTVRQNHLQIPGGGAVIGRVRRDSGSLQITLRPTPIGGRRSP